MEKMKILAACFSPGIGERFFYCKPKLQRNGNQCFQYESLLLTLCINHMVNSSNDYDY